MTFLQRVSEWSRWFNLISAVTRVINQNLIKLLCLETKESTNFEVSITMKLDCNSTEISFFKIHAQQLLKLIIRS